MASALESGATPPKKEAALPARADLILAPVLGLAALVVYLRTLYPGVGGGGDTTKFQYLGRVLGTAHPPGYPLYIFISYVFAHLPIGSPAYRINFMSAFFAACAVSLVFLILARLGCRRWIASCAALALAFDRYLWAKAVGAEVYTLAAALVALIVLLALRWERSGRNRDLYAVAAVFGVSLGNHLTVATLLPAIALFVLAVRPSTIRPGIVMVCAALVALGLTQYGFIVLRTWQHSPYVEAHATNLRELYGVLRATPYADQIFAFTPQQLLHDRLPLLWSMCRTDFDPLGLLFLGAGIGVLLVRRRAAAWLLILGAASIVFLSLNVDADVEGFLVSAFVLSWVVVGVGMEAAWVWLGAAGRPGQIAAAALALALPAWQLRLHYKANDHHGRTYETRYLNALFARLEDRAAILREAYSVDQLILYKLAGEQAAGGRTIVLIGADVPTVQRYAADEYAVYAFSGARTALEGRGFGFETVQLREPSSPGHGGIDMSPLPLFRVTRRAPCTALGNAGWRDISAIPIDGRLMLRIDNYRPFDSEAVLYLGGTGASPPSLVISQGPVAPTISIRTFRRDVSGDAGLLTAALARDALADSGGLRAAPVVQRLQLRVNDNGQYSLTTLALGERPDVAFLRATVDLNNPLRATACGWSAGDLLQGRTADAVAVGADGNALFGQGWLEPQHTPDGDVRATILDEAEIALPLAQAGAMRVTLAVEPIGDDSSAAMVLSPSLNGVALPAQALAGGWREYTWLVPSDRVRKGLNRLTIAVSAPSGSSRGATGRPRMALKGLLLVLIGAQ